MGLNCYFYTMSDKTYVFWAICDISGARCKKSTKKLIKSIAMSPDSSYIEIVAAATTKEETAVR